MKKKPGGNFRKGLAPDALKFSSSLSFDKVLYSYDIRGSIAHAEMLAKQKIITREESIKIINGLKSVGKEIETGKLELDVKSDSRNRFSADDIHMAIEKRLTKKIGSAGMNLHTARSRNDQVALDERLYLIDKVENIINLINDLQKSFVSQAEKNIDVIISGYTHLQQAQPILLSHHLLAYVSMFERDKSRLNDCLKRINLSPLGAGAFAGTSFNIDRRFTAHKLGFNDIILNSIDAVSDRDVLLEFLSACSIIMMHLSRFAEELVLWSSAEWGFIEIGEEYTTGSSMMPQKRNPDMAELIRGKTGRVYGNLMALLTVMKGLPLAYNRDMQEDKEPLFDTAKTTADCLKICSDMLRTVKFNKKSALSLDKPDLFLATDVAEFLVKKNVPFREAHTITGSIVQHCISGKINLRELSLNELRKFSKSFDDDISGSISVEGSIANKRSEGSTSPADVRKSIRYWRKKLN
ncbi:MAG: argininosuccinate lyase [Ignavibacteria bacterium]